MATALALGALPLTSDADMINVTISYSSGGEINPNGSLPKPANSELDVTASPYAGYEVFDWYVDGAPAEWSVNQQHFAFGDKDVAIYVAFVRITNLVHTTAGAGGQLSPGGNNGTLGVAWGDSVTFTATPVLYYHVDA